MFSANNFVFGGITQSISLGYYGNYNTGVIDAVGPYGLVNQYGNAIAIGNNAAQFSQGTNAIAIGQNAGQYSQGKNAIAIGLNAGQTSQPTSSIVINASGNVLSGSNSYCCYINPIQDNNSSTVNRVLTYSPATFEVNYNSAFRFVPWKDSGYNIVTSGTTSFGGAVSSSGGGAPTPAIGSNIKYIYSIIGNMMYVRFSYVNNGSVTGGSTGSGYNIFNLPAGYTINTNLVALNTTASTARYTIPDGTRCGTGVWFNASGYNTSSQNSIYPLSSTTFAAFDYYYNGSSTLVTHFYWLANNFQAVNTHYHLECSFPIN